jgi:hypothetical protein
MSTELSNECGSFSKEGIKYKGDILQVHNKRTEQTAGHFTGQLDLQLSKNVGEKICQHSGVFG